MFNWEQISFIVDRALDLSPDERITFIEDICKDDPILKANVIHFLDSIEPSENFWKKMTESGSVLANEITTSDVGIDTSQLFSAPVEAGTYRIIKLIARGGMGNVYLAEQSDGQYEREVAIKIPRHELCSKNHIERFSSERNILSELQHSNIARLYDDGVTADGRPYLVMEFVDGIPITTYCSDQNCTLSEKLNLCKQVCEAVEFAHRNLVVHRDLKPDNILVKSNGTVKVLDFGIAKILNDELKPEKSSETKENLHILSIRYAAPEQVTLGRITTATDVYALGLLLYEMITGRPPFDLKEKKLGEAEQVIRFEMPNKPSAIIRDNKQSRIVKGDLDAIIMKALHKEPDHRYATANQLIEDISRFQMNLPIYAREGSIDYQLSKFTQRNRALFFSLVVTALLVPAFISCYLSAVQNKK